MGFENWMGVIARFIPWMAGVPLGLLQRVRGHRTTAVVLKHYFRPGWEDFRTVLTKAMPKMFGDGGQKPSAKHEMNQILEGMTAKSWQADRERLLQLLAGA